jgi:hypothetical protein
MTIRATARIVIFYYSIKLYTQCQTSFYASLPLRLRFLICSSSARAFMERSLSVPT